MAAALERYTAAQLIGFARRLDPGLSDQEFVDAARRLDKLEDGWFASLRLATAQLDAMRERFLAWPRN